MRLAYKVAGRGPVNRSLESLCCILWELGCLNRRLFCHLPIPLGQCDPRVRPRVRPDDISLIRCLQPSILSLAVGSLPFCNTKAEPYSRSVVSHLTSSHKNCCIATLSCTQSTMPILGMS